MLNKRSLQLLHPPPTPSVEPRNGSLDAGPDAPWLSSSIL